MPEAVRIRSAELPDRERLLELWLELIDYHLKLEPGLSETLPSRGSLRTEIERGLGTAACRLLVGEIDREVVGFLFVEVESRHSSTGATPMGWIHEVYVRPVWRRGGTGRALVQAALSWLSERGVGRTSVRVESSNPPALEFWRKIGFESRARVLEHRLC